MTVPSRRRAGRLHFAEAVFKGLPHPRRTIAACPSWCETDHSAEVDGRRTHARAVSSRVGICSTEVQETGETSEPTIWIVSGAIRTGGQARELICELLDAVDLLEDGER